MCWEIPDSPEFARRQAALDIWVGKIVMRPRFQNVTGNYFVFKSLMVCMFWVSKPVQTELSTKTSKYCNTESRGDPCWLLGFTQYPYYSVVHRTCMCATAWPRKRGFWCCFVLEQRQPCAFQFLPNIGTLYMGHMTCVGVLRIAITHSWSYRAIPKCLMQRLNMMYVSVHAKEQYHIQGKTTL